MKGFWILVLAVASSAAIAQTTIYKHVDSQGRITYTNKPMKDAVVVELEPITTIPATPSGSLQPQPRTTVASAAPTAPADKPEGNDSKTDTKPAIKPAVAVVTPSASLSAASFPSVDSRTQKKRDEERRRILEDELDREQQDLAGVRKSMREEQQNPTLVAAVRMAQQASDASPTQQTEIRQTLDKASSRIRGLQATAAEHEKNIEALKKELGALKP